MKNIIIAILTVLLIVAATAGFISGIKDYSNKQDKVVSNAENERFHIISREWCNGSLWAIVQDTDTDQLYLQVGSNRPERIEK